MISDSTVSNKIRPSDARFRPGSPSGVVQNPAPVRLPEESNDAFRALREVVQENSGWIKPLQQEMSRVIVGQKPLLDRLLIARLTLEEVKGAAPSWQFSTGVFAPVTGRQAA